jgi:alkylation response protein AidB-like acyl-CoA dehydrogenase
MVEPDDLELFRASVRKVVERYWPTATSAGPDGADDALADLGREAATQGWFDLPPTDGLGPVLMVMGELGRVSCPLPVMDAFVARRLLDSAPSARVEIDQLLTGIAAGTIRITVTPESADQRHTVTDAASEATHVLVLPPVSGTGLRVAAVEGYDIEPGLAAPSWATLRLGRIVQRWEATPAALDDARALLRIGLAARAAGAAGRTHEMAVEHAKIRTQFGRVIGSFQAVQQRAASLEISVTGSRYLLAEAARQHDDGHASWRLAAELATQHVTGNAPSVQLGAQHTLGAIGYFAEHTAPWLFRRVHADVARIGTYRLTAGTLADVLLETDVPLPGLSTSQDSPFAQDVREVIRQHQPAGERPLQARDAQPLVDAMAARGWFGMGWPAADGGRDADAADLTAFHDELRYARSPIVVRQLAAVMLVGNSIVRFGTPEQRRAFLPKIAAGELRFCLGYSEPEAGSDLASLRTRAERREGGWVINGQKMWTSRGNEASHVWLAARTDPDAVPRHAGISVFIIGMDTPGISVSPHTSLAGDVSCTVYYDNVEIPDSALVGEVNDGWRVITHALAGERVVMGGIAVELQHQLDDLLSWARTDPVMTFGPRGSHQRSLLSRLVAELQATRVMLAAAITSTATGGGSRSLPAMVAVHSSELAEKFAEELIEILGPTALLSRPDVPGGGWFEAGLRSSLLYVIGGGTNDIQRGIIARGLGLPR